MHYPHWKREMRGDILTSDYTDSHCIRMMADLGPPDMSDLADLYDNQEEAWKAYDDKYANPKRISKDVIQKFLSNKSVEGPTHQAQMVNLYKRFRKCFLTLKVVNKEKCMTENYDVLNHVVDLIPGKYAEEFTDRLEEEEGKLPDTQSELTEAELYALLDAWLKSKSRKLELHHSHLLVKSDNNSDGGSSQDRKYGGKKDPPRLNAYETADPDDPHAYETADPDDPPPPPPPAGKPQPRASSRTGATMDDVPDQYKEAIRKGWAEHGPCPCCGAEGHIFQGKKVWGFSLSLSDCPEFINSLSVDHRADLLMKKGWCYKCLSWKHSGKDCKKEISRWNCHHLENGKVCGKAHSSWLHGTKVNLS